MSEVSLALAERVLDRRRPGDVLERMAGRLAAVAARAATGEVPAPLAAALDRSGDAVVRPLGAVDAISTYNAAVWTAIAAAASLDDAGDRACVAVVAAVASVAERDGRDGPDALAAMAIGAEIGYRVVAELERCGYATRGWDPAGAGGSIGAAAGVSALIGGTVEVVRQAIGVGATQGAGLSLVEPPLDRWLVGKAAGNGLEAALLCAAGFSGPADGIEGRRGLFTVAAPEADASRLIEQLGSRWLLSGLSSLDRTAVPGPLAKAAAGLVRAGTPLSAFAAASRT